MKVSIDVWAAGGVCMLSVLELGLKLVARTRASADAQKAELDGEEGAAFVEPKRRSSAMYHFVHQV